MPVAFKTRLKIALVSEEFQSTDEFRANDRDTMADKRQEWDIFKMNGNSGEWNVEYDLAVENESKVLALLFFYWRLQWKVHIS